MYFWPGKKKRKEKFNQFLFFIVIFFFFFGFSLSDLSLVSFTVFKSSLPTLIDIISYIDCFIGIPSFLLSTYNPPRPQFALFTLCTHRFSLSLSSMEVVINVPLPFFWNDVRRKNICFRWFCHSTRWLTSKQREVFRKRVFFYFCLLWKEFSRCIFTEFLW